MTKTGKVSKHEIYQLWQADDTICDISKIAWLKLSGLAYVTCSFEHPKLMLITVSHFSSVVTMIE